MLPNERTGQAQLQIHLRDGAFQFQPSALMLQRVLSVAYKTFVELMSPSGISLWYVAMSLALLEVLQHNGIIQHVRYLLDIPVKGFPV